jgi:hypothetical protein
LLYKLYTYIQNTNKQKNVSSFGESIAVRILFTEQGNVKMEFKKYIKSAFLQQDLRGRGKIPKKEITG